MGLLDQTLAQLDARRGELDARLVQLDAALIQLDACLVHLDQALVRLDATLGALDRSLVELDQGLVELDAGLGALDARMVQLDQALSELDARAYRCGRHGAVYWRADQDHSYREVPGMLDNTTRLWVVHISNNAKIAKRAQDEGFICIGWTRVGDLSPYDTKEKLKAAYERAFPNKSVASVRTSYNQVFKFAHEMEVGDAVVYPIKGGRDVMVGKIAGPYEFSSDPELVEGDYNNIRKVDWIERVPRVRFSSSALGSFGAFSSVSTSDDFLDEVLDVIAGKGGVLPKVAPTPVLDDETQESEDEAVNAAEDATQSTKDYLLKRWTRTAQDFEHVAAAVFRALGYTAQVQQGTGDLGVDVVAHKDPLGVTPPILKIQCKSGTSKAGAPELKQLRGTLNGGEKGILISLGGFSKDAFHTEQNDANLILIDSDRFVELFLQCYADLSPEMRHRFPLQTVYVVASSG